MRFISDMAFPGAKNHNTSDIRDELGHVYQVGDHAWMYVRATAAITAGKVVVPNLAHVSVTNITGYSNVSDRAKGVYPYIEDSGETWTVNYYVGSLLYIAGGTMAGGLKRIVKNTATRAYLSALYPEMGEGDAFTTSPDTTSDVVIISPFQVAPSSTTTDGIIQQAIGYAPYAFTADYYGYIIFSGIGNPLTGTNNNALVAGRPVIPGDDTATGYASGVANGNDYYDVVPFGTALHAGADQQATPVWIWNNFA